MHHNTSRSWLSPLFALVGIMIGGPDRCLAQDIPRLAGEYVTVYRPAGDHFPGPDTRELKAGNYYDQWVPNDHAVVRAVDGRWHAMGITHPLTSPENIHDGEYLSFHAMAPPGTLREVLRDACWTDQPKILPPTERPGEILENHAPHVWWEDKQYIMVYGPSPIRWATSPDLHKWTPRGVLFEEGNSTRDPHVSRWGDEYQILYCAGDCVRRRTSKDLRQWSEPETVIKLPDGIAPESPCMVQYNNRFYLFVCGWNGIWDRQSVAGAYQHVTYVFASDNRLNFQDARALTTIEAHAPEVFQDEQGNWFVSSAEWPRRGVSIAPLTWAKPLDIP